MTAAENAVLEALQRDGGSFARALAHLYRHGDLENRAKIKQAWPELWASGCALAKREETVGLASTGRGAK